ncbi:MAG: hypothetical protein SFU86_18795 [Pirellulaceae bacterium]|nr:hypothetical protein [Pirellulaceae bacterium]
MRAVVATLAAAALLVHVWFGCCAHHAHAMERHSAEVAHSHADCADEHGDEAESPTFPGEDCNESECAFAATAPAKLVVELAVAPLGDFAPFGSFASASQPCLLARSGFDLVFTLPLRAHLLYQVFLN